MSQPNTDSDTDWPFEPVSHSDEPETRYSSNWKHESACNLFETDHQVRAKFVDVLKEVAETLEHTVDYGAVGCSGCAYSDAPSFLFWIAQGAATETMFLKYTSNEMSKTELAEQILDTAERRGVPADWDGDEVSCVCLGDAEYYDNPPRWADLSDSMERTGDC